MDAAAEFVTEDSAWSKANGNGKGAEFDRQRAELLEGARLGHYRVALVWGIGRPSCRGAEDMLSFMSRLTDTECKFYRRSVRAPTPASGWADSGSDTGSDNPIASAGCFSRPA